VIFSHSRWTNSSRQVISLITKNLSHNQELLFYLGRCDGGLSDLKYLASCIRNAYALSFYVINFGRVYKRGDGPEMPTTFREPPFIRT
jgi:hypothetical protein